MRRHTLQTKIASRERAPRAGRRRAPLTRCDRGAVRSRPSGAILAVVTAGLLVIVVSLVSVACDRSALAPRAGLPEYREPAAIAVPGPAHLDLAGGNLLVARTDLDLDTQLGLFSVGAVWNSAARRWVWSFDDVVFVNGTFSDATGATHSIGSLAPGAAIPGTIWVKLSQAGQSGPNRIKTKGGLESTFTNGGRPLTVRWSSSPTPRLQFTQDPQGDARLHTSVIEQCIGEPVECHPLFRVQYDSAGRVREIVDRADRRALFGYDAVGNLIRARDGLDVASDRPGYRYEYSGGDLTAIVNSEGERVEYTYDAARRLLRATQVGDGRPTWSFAYRASSGSSPYQTIATDPLGAETVYRYDGHHQLLSVTDNQLAETTSFTWTDRRVTSRTTASGATTYWSYANDDVAFRMDPSRNLTSYTYQPDGVDRARPGRRPLLRRADRLGTLEERHYDASGRLLSVANGAEESVSLEYGPDEMVSGFTDPAGLSVSLSGYGEHGHPTRVGRADILQEYVYDLVGNPTEGPDLASDSGPGRGGIVSRRFDEDRNVTVVTLTDLLIGPTVSETLVTVFRSDRRPLLTARPGGGDTLFVYDELGRLVRRSQRADGSWNDTRFLYDAAGRVTSVEHANAMAQHWSYDSLGRVTSLAIRQGSAGHNFAAFTWTDGLVRSVFDTRSGTEAYSYDEAGRLVAVAYANGDQAALSWDLRSRRTGVSLESAGGSRLRTITLAYDAAGRERGVYDDGIPVLERTWESGRLSRVEYGNGLVREFSFDPELSSLSGVTMQAGGSVVESTVVQVADPECSIIANRCVSSRTLSSGVLAAATSERHHLMPREVSSPAGKRVGIEEAVEGGREKVYHYDSLSNLIRGPAGVLQYNDERNRLRAITDEIGTETLSYAYDHAGFVTSRGGVPVTWDGAGRVTSYGSDTFEWDTLGRPVSRTVEGVRTTRRFGGFVEADTAGFPTAIDLGEVRIDLTGSDTRYRHFDYRGNVKLVTDASGDIVKHYEYSAYGVDTIYGVEADTRSFARGRIIGDLVLIGHRLYDPAAARFLAPDPIDQLINQYVYTLGNPVEFWDPSGLHAVTNDQAAGAMMQGVGNSLTTIGQAFMVAGLGSTIIPGINVLTSGGLIVGGMSLIFVGDQLKARGGLLLQSGGGSGGFGGGFGAGPGLSAPDGFNEHVDGPGDHSCGAEPCAGGGGAGGVAELSTLAGLGGPARYGGGGGGGGCAPIGLGEQPLPEGSLALLLLANGAIASLAWRRSRIVRSVPDDT